MAVNSTWVDTPHGGPLIWIFGSRLSLDSTATCWLQTSIPNDLKLALKELRTTRSAVGPAAARATKANAALPLPGDDAIDAKIAKKLEAEAVKATALTYDAARLAKEAAQRFHNSVQKIVGENIKIKSIRVGNGDCVWVNGQKIAKFVW